MLRLKQCYHFKDHQALLHSSNSILDISNISRVVVRKKTPVIVIKHTHNAMLAFCVATMKHMALPKIPSQTHFVHPQAQFYQRIPIQYSVQYLAKAQLVDFHNH